MAMWPGSAAISRQVLPFVASRINHLSICWWANAGGKKDPLGGIPPNGSFLVFITIKINHHGR
jgi:hypothetical protein